LATLILHPRAFAGLILRGLGFVSGFVLVAGLGFLAAVARLGLPALVLHPRAFAGLIVRGLGFVSGIALVAVRRILIGLVLVVLVLVLLARFARL
jgi:hypothetical protein